MIGHYSSFPPSRGIFMIVLRFKFQMTTQILEGTLKLVLIHTPTHVKDKLSFISFLPMCTAHTPQYETLAV